MQNLTFLCEKKIVNINVVVYSLKDAIALHCLVGCYGKIKNLNWYLYVYMGPSIYNVVIFKGEGGEAICFVKEFSTDVKNK